MPESSSLFPVEHGGGRTSSCVRKGILHISGISRALPFSYYRATPSPPHHQQKIYILSATFVWNVQQAAHKYRFSPMITRCLHEKKKHPVNTNNKTKAIQQNQEWVINIPSITCNTVLHNTTHKIPHHAPNHPNIIRANIHGKKHTNNNNLPSPLLPKKALSPHQQNVSYVMTSS